MANMRILTVCGILLVLASLCGCPGSVLEPLPPGGGQGNYVGRFTDEADTQVFGSFELEIDELGVVEGSGLLNGRDVDIRGILTGDDIDGYIDDTLIHTTGSFEGRRTVAGYLGEFNLDQGPEAPDIFGFWDCVVDE